MWLFANQNEAPNAQSAQTSSKKRPIVLVSDLNIKKNARQALGVSLGVGTYLVVEIPLAIIPREKGDTWER